MNAMLIPAHLEQRRLEMLQDLAILDSPADFRFDRIAWLATELFAAPIAAISLLDRERQWFKSEIGLGVRETARSVAFCEFAVAGDAPLMVADATRDPRFQNNPLVTGAPFVRSYLGVLVRVRGVAVGTLCIIDRQPRDFYENDVHLLSSLAEWVSSEFERESVLRANVAPDRGTPQDRQTGPSGPDGFQQGG